MIKSLRLVEIETPAVAPTVVRLNFDDDFTDSNSSGIDNTWMAAGGSPAGAFIDPSKSVAGGASLRLSSASYITTPGLNETFNFEDGSFTIEFYFWNNQATGAVRNICGKRDTNAGPTTTREWSIQITAAGNILAATYQGSITYQVQSSSVFGISTAFHHVSFERDGSVLNLYIDGVLESSLSSPSLSGFINDTSGDASIGRDGENTANLFDGWIDEFTVHLYARRGGDNFTPERTRAQIYTADRTWRFAIDAGYLPTDFGAIPSITDVQIDPATVSLGEDLGARASVTVKFRDHRHILFDDAFTSGSFWGKFRARYGTALQGFALRVLTGQLGDGLDAFEARHFLIESTDGPNGKGEFQIIGKDVLKLADGDRSQAPILSNGFLVADITNSATTLTLSPAGIGDDEYEASGVVAIGGSELCIFTRVGDVLTISRGDFNTEAVAHSAQDRVQTVLEYAGDDPSDIINDLLTNYAGVDPAWINLSNWQDEISTYLGTVYGALICEPTSVSQLVSELIEQAGLVVWWDDVDQQIRLRVLRPIPSSADTYDGNIIMADSMEVTEQPDKRLTRVYTYFAQINALKNLDQLDNFRSTSFIIDSDAEASHGGIPMIKNIYSRWIAAGGRSIADSIGNVLLARFHEPPRRIKFNLLRGSLGGATPVLGAGYQIANWMFQDSGGDPVNVPAQITRLNPAADVFEVEVEEISPDFPAGGFGGGSSPGEHVIIIDANDFNIDLRDMHDSLYGVPTAGNVVTVTIVDGVAIGSTTAAHTAFDVGDWPGGVTITITINGSIVGCGGNGGNAASAGSGGGTAFYTRQAVTVINTAGLIGGGGGGGGGGGYVPSAAPNSYQFSCGGGGGAGSNSGSGGSPGPINPSQPGSHGNPGDAGSFEFGGDGGIPVPSTANQGFRGGDGGDLGFNGAAGHANNPATGTIVGQGAGGSAGLAIDGVSFVTFSGPSGDIRGSQVN